MGGHASRSLDEDVELLVDRYTRGLNVPAAYVADGIRQALDERWPRETAVPDGA